MYPAMSITMHGSRIARWQVLVLVSAVVLLAFCPFVVQAAKHGDFKTCSQSSFCRRLRSLSERAQADGFHSPYSLIHAHHDPSAEGGPATWMFPLKTELYPEISFELKVDVLQADDGIARIRVDELNSKTPWKRYGETPKWALVDAEPAVADKSEVKFESHASTTVISYGDGHSLSLVIQHSPLKITHKRHGKTIMVINERGLFHMEHFRPKEPEPHPEGQVSIHEGMDRTWFEGEPDKDLFEETFSKWTDSKPKGPEGYSFDVSFPGVEHVFGLAEHATPLSLPATDGTNYSEPYRLYNVDIFEYEASSTMALYGSIPLLHAQSPDHSVGLLSLVGSETWVDVVRPPTGVKTHWMSESGVMDLFILPGPDPNALFKQYAALTGPTPIPPLWSLGYHQCRWNYWNTEDVLEVDRKFDEADIPLDVTWLDIEYAEEHRYFDWNKHEFPDPVKMLDAVGAKGRKMVAIVDPHIKKTDSFRIYTDAVQNDLLVKKVDGSNFEGWCWTGSSVWVDFFNEKSWSWWKRMFSFDTWKDSSKFLFIWNDMNEPSVFDGPEITMGKDNKHVGGWEHRDLHNINGMMFHRATHDALLARETPAKRPFVLSRSFFAGSQRYGAIWTGDNMGTWEHFAGETAMLLSNNIAGMTFCGADVGGFFGNPSVEMLVRWYQAGAFMPFFRAHAHIDTKRREPYLYDEPYKGMMRDAIRLRYQMLPIWYTAFHEASRTGAPTMRPQYAVFPKDAAGFPIDDQYYVGSSGLLFKPVTAPGVDQLDVYLADNQPYYNYFSFHLYPPSSTPRRVNVPAPLDTFPLLVRGGSILPIRERVRRSSTLMWRDPFTLVVAVGKDGSAEGELYLDDGDSYAYRQGQYIHRSFKLAPQGKHRYSFRSSNLVGVASDYFGGTELASYSPDENAWAKAIATVRVEQIVILGLSKEPSSVTVGGSKTAYQWTAGKAATSHSEGEASHLIIKDPKVLISYDWDVEIA